MAPNRTTAASIIIMIFIFSLGAAGQTFNGGILGGISATQVSGDNSAGYNKVGLTGGLFANFHLSDKILLQGEMSYIMKGSRERPDENNLRSYKLNLDYIETPIMLKYLYSEKFSFEAGLAYSILINQYEEIDYIIDDSRPCNTHNLSFIAGLYYNLTEKFSANIRASNSILPIRKHMGGQTYLLNLGQYNNILTFMVFYTI